VRSDLVELRTNMDGLRTDMMTKMNRLRGDMMARMDRLQDSVTALQDDVTVNFGHSDRIERVARGHPRRYAP
jgi:hypothetical protein